MVRKDIQERKFGMTIAFDLAQIQFMDENRDFNIQKFCRDKLYEYMELRKLGANLDEKTTD